MSVAPREVKVLVLPARKLPHGPSSFAYPCLTSGMFGLALFLSSLSTYAQIWMYPDSVVHGVIWFRTPTPSRFPMNPLRRRIMLMVPWGSPL